MRFTFSRAAVRARHRSAALALAACAAFAGPAIYAAAASSAPSVALEISKFTFAPKDITIAPGTRVVWTGNDRSFASKGLDTDDTFEHVFATEGDFGYICTVHPFMTGVVHVRKQ